MIKLFEILYPMKYVFFCIIAILFLMLVASLGKKFVRVSWGLAVILFVVYLTAI